MIGFELHRWEDGRIVEHWDNLQTTPDAPNPSGRTMTDGASEVTDLDFTDANKVLAQHYTNVVLIGGQLDKIGDFFRGDQLAQHSPLVGDGVGSLRSFLETRTRTYRRRHRVIGEGNLVLVVAEGMVSKDPALEAEASFYDLYRIEAGAIAEHWEVVEVIALRDEWCNDNGKF